MGKGMSGKESGKSKAGRKASAGCGEESGKPAAGKEEAALGLPAAMMAVPVKVRVELGSRLIPLGELSRLTRGSVLELDVLAGEAMTVYANDRAVARGEVVVVNDRFGIRLTELLG